VWIALALARPVVLLRVPGVFFLLLVLIAVAVAAVTWAGWQQTLHGPNGSVSFFESYWLYVVWAAVQQFLLQCFLMSRLMRLLRHPTLAVLAAAILFAATHLPSPILTAITLICGVASCLFFLRYRNLYALAIAHAILGIAISITIPGPVDHNMRVGLSYLTYAPDPAPSSRP
jgi:membrane protease YdiL (CAAX protease family)